MCPLACGMLTNPAPGTRRGMLLRGLRLPLPKNQRIRCLSTAVMAPKNKQQQQDKRSGHYSSHIQLFNVDNSTAAPSVLLFFDNDRYLFNAGEGIQRHFFEHKQKLNKIGTVLSTRVEPSTLGGLPGMLLSQVGPQDSLTHQAVKATVIGPQRLLQYTNAFRIYASTFRLDVKEIGPADMAPVVQDAHVTITPVPLTAAPPAAEAAAAAPAVEAAAAAAAAEEPAAAGAEGDEPAAKKQRTEPELGGEAAAGAAQRPPHGQRAVAAGGCESDPPLAVCYICRLASNPGKFDPKKAAELGVPRGPLFGQLQRGMPVTSVTGKTVNPADVMATPEIPGAVLVIIDCPDPSYLPALQSSPQLEQLREQQQQAAAAQSSSGAAAPAAAAAAADDPAAACRLVMLHLGPQGVTSSDEYRSWMSGFGGSSGSGGSGGSGGSAGVTHLLMSSDSQLSTTTLRAAELQAQLNVIEPQLFSLQGFDTLLKQRQQQQATAEGDTSTSSSSSVIAAGNGLRVTLAPARARGLTNEAVTGLPDLAGVQAAVRERQSLVMQLLQQYQQQKADVLAAGVPPQLEGISRTSAELTLLGTCSATPSNHRNVSAYYLDLFARGGLLLDCGEDTMGQLERRFGRTSAAARIAGLAAVWISHMHADHHGGLYGLLLHRQQLLQQQQQADAPPPPPLLVLGPWPLFRVLCEYQRALPGLLAFHFLPNTYFYGHQARQPPASEVAAYEAAKAAAGLAVLEPFAVQHIAHSSGIKVASNDGWSIVFSGDTRPCQSVIDAARGATLLVHEATFEDGLESDAAAKRHSTTGEALGVAAAAGAFRTVLTHFSSRYPKIPVMKPPAPAAEAAGAEGTEGGDAAAAAAAAGSDLAAVGSVIVGFDLMSINLADLAWAPKTLPVLDELFREEEAAWERQDDDAGAGEA